jgi:hypothetical protein
MQVALVVVVGAVISCVGCSSPAKRETHLANAAQPTPVRELADRDALVHSVLERYLAYGTLDDDELLPKQGPIYVMTEVGADPIDHRIVPAALPEAKRPFVLRTAAELQAEADRAGKEVAFIHFYSITVEGSWASVSAGGDILLPTKTNAVKTCCCSSSRSYEKHAGRWTIKAGPHVVSCG